MACCVEVRAMVRLSGAELQGLLAGMSGVHWAAVVRAFEACGVEGADIEETLADGPEGLQAFLEQDLQCPVPSFVVKKLHRKLLAATCGSERAWQRGRDDDIRRGT